MSYLLQLNVYKQYIHYTLFSQIFFYNLHQFIVITIFTKNKKIECVYQVIYTLYIHLYYFNSCIALSIDSYTYSMSFFSIQLNATRTSVLFNAITPML